MAQTNHVYNTANDLKTHNDAPFMYFVKESGTDANPFPDVGITMYKSFAYDYEATSGNIVTFGNHIRDAVEPYAGAHYYLRSRYSDNNNSVRCKINLNNVTLNRGTGNRNAFLSLGIVSDGIEMKQCDFGLGNVYNKSGWRAATYSRKWTTGGDNIFNRVSGDFDNTVFTGIVTITVANESTLSQDILRCTVSDSSNTVVITYTAVAGTYFSRNTAGKACLRFVRFMSLVPQNEAQDDADNSVLEATMYDIKLNNSTWQATDIEHAWSVQGSNITNLHLGNVTSNGSSYHTTDYIRIYHQYQLV